MQRKSTRIVVAVLILPLLATLHLGMAFPLVHAADDGSLDAAFDTDGIVTTDFGAGDFGYGVSASEAIARFVMAGYAYTGQSHHFAPRSRYTINGSLDPSFGTNGKVTTDFLGATEHARRNCSSE